MRINYAFFGGKGKFDFEREKKYGNLQDLAGRAGFGPRVGTRTGGGGPSGGGLDGGEMRAWPLSSVTRIAGDPGQRLSRVQNILNIYWRRAGGAPDRTMASRAQIFVVMAGFMVYWVPTRGR